MLSFDKWSVETTKDTNWTPYDVAPMTGEAAVPDAPRALPFKFRFALGNVSTMHVNNDQRRTVNDTWYKWLPFFNKAVVIGQPAISPTATVLTNNAWDWKFGLIGSPVAPVTPSNVNYPVGTVPTTGM